MKIYLCGPMTGIKEFNFPAFHNAADRLRSEGHEVFSPADADEHRHGKDFSKGTTGDPNEISTKGFSLRDALGEDLSWICKEADAIALLPGWEYSSGGAAEWATAKALKLKFIYLD